MPITILIVEDHDLVRKALGEWVAAKFPGCHIIEATSGEEATARIKAMIPATQVVILSLHDDKAHRARATRAGANAYVCKGRITSNLQPMLAALLPP